MEIRPGTADDAAAILELDDQVLPSRWNRRSLENWRWKFAENPSGKADIWTAWKDGRLVGHFATVPFPFWDGTREVMAAHSIGSLVDPAWQRKGLLKVLADRLFAEHERRGVEVVWGFPNALALGIHLGHMGYRTLFETSPLSLDAAGLGQGRLDERVVLVDRFDGQADALWEAHRPSGHCAVVRRATHLNWRWRERPDHAYRVLGLFEAGALKAWVALKEYHEEGEVSGHLLDFFPQHDPDLVEPLLGHALALWAGEGVTRALLWYHGEPFWDGLWRRWGFQPVSGARPLVLRAPEALQEPGLWSFAMGDSTEIY